MTRGQLPQRAGSPGLNGNGADAAVPSNDGEVLITTQTWRVWYLSTDQTV